MRSASLSLLASSQLTCDPTGRTRGVRDPSGSTSGCRSPRAGCGSRGGECARLRIQCATPTTPRPRKKEHAQSDTAQGLHCTRARNTCAPHTRVHQCHSLKCRAHATRSVRQHVTSLCALVQLFLKLVGGTLQAGRFLASPRPSVAPALRSRRCLWWFLFFSGDKVFLTYMFADLSVFLSECGVQYWFGWYCQYFPFLLFVHSSRFYSEAIVFALDHSCNDSSSLHDPLKISLACHVGRKSPR